MSKEATIVTSIAVIFVIIFGVLIWKAPSFTAKKPVNPELVVRADSHMTASSSAKVTIVEFGDYECPACGALYPLLHQVLEKYKDNKDVNFVFRNYPLPQHTRAMVAAEAAEAAGLQGKYFAMHSALYENQKEWAAADADVTALLSKYAQEIGLDMTKFKAAMDNPEALDARIKSDKSDGVALGVDHTPTLYINNTEITSISGQGLDQTIQAELNK